MCTLMLVQSDTKAEMGVKRQGCKEGGVNDALAQSDTDST